jgi:hypothetical protein
MNRVNLVCDDVGGVEALIRQILSDELLITSMQKTRNKNDES